MSGWIVPPPREPLKGRGELQREREEKVHWLVRHGFLRSERIKAAMLKVRREDFIPLLYRDYAYQEVPIPSPVRAPPSPAHTATRSSMRRWDWTRDTACWRSASAPAMALPWRGKSWETAGWWFP